MKHLIPCIITLLLVMFSCAEPEPEGLLSTGEMENILYDMHLAQSLYDSREGVKSDEDIITLRASVLEKHDVDQAVWDSSFSYYCKNADELRGIYKNLAERIDRDIMALGGQLDGGGADSTDVWNKEKAFILMQQSPYNLYTFDITPDTTFRDGDKIQLHFDTQMIFQDGFRDITAFMAVCYQHPDDESRDSVGCYVTHLSSDGHGMLVVNNETDRLHVKRIKGYFILLQNLSEVSSNINQTTLRMAAIRNVRLLHEHTEAPKPVEQEEKSDKDSISEGDGVVKRDSIKMNLSKPKII